MDIEQTALPGVLIIKPVVHHDARGYLFESYRSDKLAAAGLPAFVQDNQSRSVPRTIRGLHYQLARPQAKLVRVLRGQVFDVAVDIRRGSPTFGRWVGQVLSADNKVALYIPPGFAHGFCAMGQEDAEVLYRCSDYYSGPGDQKGVLFNDPGLGINWPIEGPLVSDKDAALLPLDPARADLPLFELNSKRPGP